MAVEREVLLPDIGDFEEVDVSEVLRAAGDRVAFDEPLIVLESDKAIMEIPAPWAGIVKEIRVAVGDKVSRGHVIAVMELDEAETAPESSGEASAEPAPTPVSTPAESGGGPPSRRTVTPGPAEAVEPVADPARAPGAAPHASPLARRTARELGVDLALVQGTGAKGRVLEENIQAYVREALGQPTGASRQPQPGDGAALGLSEVVPLERVRQIAAANLHRSWITVPHVTQFDEADVTELEEFRRTRSSQASDPADKLTLLPFVLKAVTHTLKEFPRFNASLDESGASLIVKRYFHIGVAVDTPSGLVVPVVRDADRKGIGELAAELRALSEKARARRLGPADLQGGTFSISSLGGIGGKFFTPIVNHPEVAVLGVSRMEWKPVHRDGEFVPRRMLPLSLSYDHRVIDGAEAVRFTTRLAELLCDLRLLLL